MRKLRTRGLTLTEVVISSAVLAAIMLALLSVTLPLSDASSSQAGALDMDRDAARVLARLREDLRRSGYEPGGAPRVRVRTTAQPNDTLELHVRVAPDGAAAPWRPPGAAWADPIRWSTAPANGRLMLRRTEGGRTVEMSGGVERVEFTLPANSQSMTVTLTLARRVGRGGKDVTRVYTDQVQMMNRPR